MTSKDTDLTLRAGRAADAPAIAEHLRQTGGRCIAESEEWIRERAAAYRLATSREGRIVATAALLPAEDGMFVLRSVAVAASARGRGLAQRMLAATLDDPVVDRSAIWCRTTTPGLFESAGFRVTGRAPGFDGRPRYVMVRGALTTGSDPGIRETSDRRPRSTIAPPALPEFPSLPPVLDPTVADARTHLRRSISE